MRLVKRQTPETIVAAELNDDDGGMQRQDGAQGGNGIFCGGAAGAVICYLVAVAAPVQVPLQRVGIRLASLESVARRDAVAIANKQRPVGGR